MFVHSGAALHRHEFSAPLDPKASAVTRRTSLPRSAFSTPSIPRRASTYESPSPAPLTPRPARPRSALPPRRTTEPVVRFHGPETETMSEDARSVANSDISEVTSAVGRPRRRALRTSTTFHLAHPAPTLTQKQRLIHIRPRLLLQLQRLSPDSRPEPAIDVLPSAAVMPRLAKKFPRMFRGKAVLGTNDVVLVRSEEYDSPDDSATETTDSDEESPSNRDMLAVICQLPKDAGGSQGKAEIVLSDGSVWLATPLLNGLYELTTVDENGNKITARWVKRSTRRSSADFSSSAPGSTPFKYTFSIIDPNSRRHPVMGTLTHNTLDVPDFYTSVSSSAKRYPPTTHIRPLFGEHDSADEGTTPERTTHAVDEEVKSLVQVTGIWVALREGLSPHFKYNDSMSNGSVSAGNRGGSHCRARSVSLTPEPRRPAMGATNTSTPEPGHSALAAVGGKFRRAYGGPPPLSPAALAPQLEELKTPQRSTSAGTAFMQRVAARRSWRQSNTVQSESDADSVVRRPRHSMLEYGSFVTSPPSLILPGSSTASPGTPTKAQRRTQSVYAPSTLPPTLHTFEAAVRHGVDPLDRHEDLDLEWVVKPKISRWKAFTNFFRRSHQQTRPPST